MKNKIPKHKKTKKNKKSNKTTRKTQPSQIGENTAKNHLIVGKIYADWCGHCEDLKPKWETMENDIITNYAPPGYVKPTNEEPISFVFGNNAFKIYKINEQNKDGPISTINSNYLVNSNQKLQASGYPTIFKICDNQLEYYQGEREPEPMKQWFISSMNKPTMMGGSIKKQKNKKTKKRHKK
jgi:thiol-disulfide isomerase/thioredoxin